jgi:hypothetical protein
MRSGCLRHPRWRQRHRAVDRGRTAAGVGSPQAARETYLTAWAIAVTFTDPASLLQVSKAVRLLPPPAESGRWTLLLDGYALLVTDGRAAAADTLRRAAAALVNLPAEQALRRGWVATGGIAAVWDDEGMREVSDRWIRLARDGRRALQRTRGYPEAMRAALATTYIFEPGISTWLLPELVEVASRAGTSTPAGSSETSCRPEYVR